MTLVRFYPGPKYPENTATFLDMSAMNPILNEKYLSSTGVHGHFIEVHGANALSWQKYRRDGCYVSRGGTDQEHLGKRTVPTKDISQLPSITSSKITQVG